MPQAGLSTFARVTASVSTRDFAAACGDRVGGAGTRGVSASIPPRSYASTQSWIVWGRGPKSRDTSAIESPASTRSTTFIRNDTG